MWHDCENIVARELTTLTDVALFSVSIVLNEFVLLLPWRPLVHDYTTTDLNALFQPNSTPDDRAAFKTSGTRPGQSLVKSSLRSSFSLHEQINS